jgi:hypothetical protein
MPNVTFRGFCDVLNCLLKVDLGYVGVLCGFFVLTVRMILGGFPMMHSRVFMVLSSLLVMIRGVHEHGFPLSLRFTSLGRAL